MAAPAKRRKQLSGKRDAVECANSLAKVMNLSKLIVVLFRTLADVEVQNDLFTMTHHGSIRRRCIVRDGLQEVLQGTPNGQSEDLKEKRSPG